MGDVWVGCWDSPVVFFVFLAHVAVAFPVCCLGAVFSRAAHAMAEAQPVVWTWNKICLHAGGRFRTSLEAYTVMTNFRIDASGEVVPGDRLGLVPVKDDKDCVRLLVRDRG